MIGNDIDNEKLYSNGLMDHFYLDTVKLFQLGIQSIFWFHIK